LLAARPAPRIPVAQHPVVGFAELSNVVSQQSDTATVTLYNGWLARGAGTPQASTGPLQVRLATAPSPAIGVNLQAVDQIVTFVEGEDRKSVTVPIITGAPNSGEVDVTLTLTLVEGPPDLVVESPAVLRIKASSDVIPPTIVGSQVTSKGIELTFSEPMDPTRVQNTANYFVQSTTKKNRDPGDILGDLFLGKWGGSGQSNSTTERIPLRSVTYDPTTQTATLVPKRRLNPLARLTISSSPQTKRSARPGQRSQLAHQLTDLAGNAIVGALNPGRFVVFIQPRHRAR
jgi:hypothetical protein